MRTRPLPGALFGPPHLKRLLVARRAGVVQSAVLGAETGSPRDSMNRHTMTAARVQ
jgi:hypothetical protein